MLLWKARRGMRRQEVAAAAVVLADSSGGIAAARHTIRRRRRVSWPEPCSFRHYFLLPASSSLILQRGLLFPSSAGRPLSRQSQERSASLLRAPGRRLRLRRRHGPLPQAPRGLHHPAHPLDPLGVCREVLKVRPEAEAPVVARVRGLVDRLLERRARVDVRLVQREHVLDREDGQARGGLEVLRGEGNRGGSGALLSGATAPVGERRGGGYSD